MCRIFNIAFLTQNFIDFWTPSKSTHFAAWPLSPESSPTHLLRRKGCDGFSERKWFPHQTRREFCWGTYTWVNHKAMRLSAISIPSEDWPCKAATVPEIWSAGVFSSRFHLGMRQGTRYSKTFMKLKPQYRHLNIGPIRIPVTGPGPPFDPIVIQNHSSMHPFATPFIIPFHPVHTYIKYV